MSIFEVILNEGRGTVEAVNYLSAKEQFKWLLTHKECFCEKHCEEYYKDYSVIMNPLDNSCKTVFPKGVLVTPSDSSGGLGCIKYIG